MELVCACRMADMHASEYMSVTGVDSHSIRISFCDWNTLSVILF